MDTHRTSADLRAVQDHVVGLGQTPAGIALEVAQMIILGCSERMMASVPALGFLVVFEHREIHHP